MAIVLPFIVLAAAYVVYKLFFIPDPAVIGIEEFDFLPLDKTVSLQAENVKSIDVAIYQGEHQVELLNDTPETGGKIYSLQIKPKTLDLKNGPAFVIIKARAGFFKKIKYEIKTLVDMVPPALEVLSAPVFVEQGGGGFALLSAKDADSVFITLADKTFMAFKASPGTDAAPGSARQNEAGLQGEPGRSQRMSAQEYYVFFPAPYDMKEDSVYYATAKDAAGNQSIKALPSKIKMKSYDKSTINIDSSFVDMVVSPLLNEMNISDKEGAFKKVNEEMRADSQMKLIDISEETEPKKMWEGRFLQLRNSKVMAVYGDERTYKYEGREISRSVHLGYDLASFANAPVQAANSGVIRFADELSIYGNTVIIDHGLGLMSLYGHLSTILVKKGQAIRKGDIIAKTGATGLAGGDHLHFAILIHGYEVSPLYWWDAHWINVNVENRIR